MSTYLDHFGEFSLQWWRLHDVIRITLTRLYWISNKNHFRYDTPRNGIRACTYRKYKNLVKKQYRQLFWSVTSWKIDAFIHALRARKIPASAIHVIHEEHCFKILPRCFGKISTSARETSRGLICKIFLNVDAEEGPTRKIIYNFLTVLNSKRVLFHAK